MILEKLNKTDHTVIFLETPYKIQFSPDFDMISKYNKYLLTETQWILPVSPILIK